MGKEKKVATLSKVQKEIHSFFETKFKRVASIKKIFEFLH